MEVNIQEVWITVHGYPRFSVSNTGKVYDNENANLLSQKVSGKYYAVSLPGQHWSKRHWLVHRLMILSFFGIITNIKFPCNHKDGNKLNNSLHNLEVVTAAENVLHSYKMKLNKGAWSKVKNTDHYKRWRSHSH